MTSPAEKDVMEDTGMAPVFSLTKENLNEEAGIHAITSVKSPLTGKVVEITNDVDAAMAFAVGDKHVEWTEEKDRKLLRKIDLYLCPIMCLSYCMQFMDKTSTGYAAVMGLRTDLHMVGKDYSWTGSAFYLGYLFFELPASLLLQRFPLVKTLFVFTILWGMILALHAVPQYPGFVALRTILGMLESAITPAFVLLTSQWYRKDETFIRTAFWFAFNGLGTIVGNCIAYGLYIHKDSYSMDAWKLVFVIIGVMTIFLGFIFVVHLPDLPVKAWFLTEEEKLLVVERVRGNQQGFGNRHFKWSQFLEAMIDYRTWLVFIFGFLADVPNGGITNFASILISGMGYDTKETLLLGLGNGAVELVMCPIFALMTLLPFFPKHRMFWAVAATIVTLVGAILLAYGPNSGSKLTGYYILGVGPVGMICVLSCFASNVAGTTKKATVSAMYLIGYCTGNLVGPQTFYTKQAPTYSSATEAMVICYVLAVVDLMILYASYWYDNKRRDAAKAKLVESGEYVRVENIEFADLTDKQNPEFRYVL